MTHVVIPRCFEASMEHSVSIILVDQLLNITFEKAKGVSLARCEILVAHQVSWRGDGPGNKVSLCR